MRPITISIALGALLPAASAILAPRAVNDPALKYISHMCLPNLSNATRTVDLNLTVNELTSSLAHSPFPCEQGLYILAVCTANGTQEVDFLAEQQCLCNGSYFDVSSGCYACYFAHGYQEITPEEASSSQASLSTAECSPSPPFQPYSNLFPPFDIKTLENTPSWTLANDQFPNMTAVSNYFTASGSVAPGAITGSATARQTSWTNFDGVRYTPASVPPNSGTGAGSAEGSMTTTAAGVSDNGSATSTSESSGSSSSPAATPNIAAEKEVQAVGGFVAAVLGLAILL